MCCSNKRRNGCYSRNNNNNRAVIYTPATTAMSTPAETIPQYQEHRQPSPEALTEAANGEILQRVGIEPPSYDTAVFDSDFGDDEAKHHDIDNTARAVFIQGEERGPTRHRVSDSSLSSPLSSSSSSSLDTVDSRFTGDKAWLKLEKRAWKAERKAEKRAWKAARKAAKAERKAMC